MVVWSPEEFAEAVHTYRFHDVQLDPAAMDAARRTLSETGLVLVGEPHGVDETPAVLYALAAALGIRAVAFEWSHEELDGLVGRSLASGSFDFGDYWALPASSELFAGDGRITAGHFALLERLRADDLLDQLILYDRLDPDPPPEWHVRDSEMAERLLTVPANEHLLLVLTGAFHAQTAPLVDGEPMGRHLAKARPGLEPAMLDYAVGHCWSHGAIHDVSGPMPPAPITLALPHATPAVVPGKRDPAGDG